jgi:subtilisin family serine protease
MCGNFGPEVDIAAPTPDVLWARPPDAFGPGAGTSTATPQVAAAAALWLSFHRAALVGFSPTEKVEACVRALLTSARREGPLPYEAGGKRNSQYWNEYFGVGHLDVAAALDVVPQPGLPPLPRDSVQNALTELFGMLGDDAGRGSHVEQLWATTLS